MSSACSVCFELWDTSDLIGCRRHSWRVPTPCPQWDQVKSESDSRAVDSQRELARWKGDWREERAWREKQERREKQAWREKEARDSSSPIVCTSSDKICKKCILFSARNSGGCTLCKVWECKSCREDQELPKVFEEEHEKSPLTYTDDYGRRERAPNYALKLERCFRCLARVCRGCHTRCYGLCDRPICESCQSRQGGSFTLTSSCPRCKYFIENNDDGAIGPIDRKECYYSLGFHRQPLYCRCGKKSCDGLFDYREAEEEGTGNKKEEEEDSVDGYDGDAPMIVNANFLEGFKRWKHCSPLIPGKSYPWKITLRRFKNGESLNQIAENQNSGRPIQIPTVFQHLLEAILQGHFVDLSRCTANQQSLRIPNRDEWHALEIIEKNWSDVDVTSAPDRPMICGKISIKEFLMRSLGILAWKKSDMYDEVEKQAMQRWYGCLNFYLTMRRVGVKPLFQPLDQEEQVEEEDKEEAESFDEKMPRNKESSNHDNETNEDITESKLLKRKHDER